MADAPHSDEWAALGARVVALAERLVATPSVVDTPGEADCGELLLEYLRERTATMKHVEVRRVTVDKRPPCSALLATCEPPSPAKRTLVLLGHFDTVGIEPYGALAEIAFDSEKLKEHFREATEDWAHGRGWLDMKGGVAAIVEVFLREAELRELSCNLVLALTPDEESASRGVRAIIPELNRLRRERGWELAYVINADYTAPQTVGDTRPCFYSGTVGKLLLGISVFGKPTHVGETFAGVNATALAGYLAGALEHDRKLMAGVGGEWLPPPTVLHVADRRERYDVMTADCAELYVNVFHAGGEPKKQWRALLTEVHRLVKLWDRQQRLKYNRYVARANARPPRYELRPEVIGYRELLSRVRPRPAPARTAAEMPPPQDERDSALFLIRELYSKLPPGRPTVVVSLLPPFYPAQLNAPEQPDTARLLALTRESGLTHRRIYPYIADMSYFAFEERAISGWETNAPLWFDAAELAELAAAAAPVCNLGPWGSGAHSSVERVYLPYLRDELPRLIADALRRLAL